MWFGLAFDDRPPEEGPDQVVLVCWDEVKPTRIGARLADVPDALDTVRRLSAHRATRPRCGACEQVVADVPELDR